MTRKAKRNTAKRRKKQRREKKRVGARGERETRGERGGKRTWNELRAGREESGPFDGAFVGSRGALRFATKIVALPRSPRSPLLPPSHVLAE